MKWYDHPSLITYIFIGGLVEGDQVGMEACEAHHRPEGEETHHHLQHSEATVKATTNTQAFCSVLFYCILFYSVSGPMRPISHLSNTGGNCQCLPVCLCLMVSWSFCLSVCIGWFIGLSVRGLSVGLAICRSVSLCVCLSLLVSPSSSQLVSLSIYMSISRLVGRSVRLFISWCLSISSSGLWSNLQRINVQHCHLSNMIA